MKTVREWLNELPDGYRERALANLDESEPDEPAEDIVDAISQGWIWVDAPEGHGFWSSVARHYRRHSTSPLPPLPTDPIDQTADPMRRLERRIEALEREHSETRLMISEINKRTRGIEPDLRGM